VASSANRPNIAFVVEQIETKLCWYDMIDDSRGAGPDATLEDHSAALAGPQVSLKYLKPEPLPADRAVFSGVKGNIGGRVGSLHQLL
jgi:hypothetical protein